MTIYDLLTLIPARTISVGFSSFSFVEDQDLKSAQVGYSVDDQGNDLTGTPPERWSKDWVVIGCDGLVGDPIFVNSADPLYPVFNSAHGEGAWDPIPIADNFRSFCLTMRLLLDMSRNRDNPVAYEANPLSETEKQGILTKISLLNPQCELEFWRIWLEQ
jgi:hypothetical protein